MLKNIPGLLPSELIAAMLDMGEGDELLLSGCYFPAKKLLGKNATLVRLPVSIEEALSAILKLLPLYSRSSEYAATVCLEQGEEAAVYPELLKIIKESEEADKLPNGFDALERYSFEKRASEASIIVVTTEIEGNILLKKGRI